MDENKKSKIPPQFNNEDEEREFFGYS